MIRNIGLVGNIVGYGCGIGWSSSDVWGAVGWGRCDWKEKVEELYKDAKEDKCMAQILREVAVT